MAYTILRTEVPLTGTPLEDRYSLTSLSFKELEKDGFSRQDSESGLLKHVSGGSVIFPCRGEKIPKAIVLATSESHLDEAYQSFLKIIEGMKKQNGS